MGSESNRCIVTIPRKYQGSGSVPDGERPPTDSRQRRYGACRCLPGLMDGSCGIPRITLSNLDPGLRVYVDLGVRKAEST